MKKILEVNNLSKTYHTDEVEIDALNNINFSVYEGEFISIVGPSGCGKSTILSILSNLIDSSNGNISINGETEPFITTIMACDGKMDEFEMYEKLYRHITENRKDDTHNDRS